MIEKEENGRGKDIETPQKKSSRKRHTHTNSTQRKKIYQKYITLAFAIFIFAQDVDAHIAIHIIKVGSKCFVSSVFGVFLSVFRSFSLAPTPVCHRFVSFGRAGVLCVCHPPKKWIPHMKHIRCVYLESVSRTKPHSSSVFSIRL